MGFLIVGILLIVFGAGTWGTVQNVPGIMVVLGVIILIVSILAMFRS